MLTVNIPSLIKQIKKEKAWDENDRNAITVFKGDKLRIILVALHKKAVMTTERPENIFSIHVLEGKIEVQTTNDAVQLQVEELFILHANIPYKIEAIKKSIFLMTVVE